MGVEQEASKVAATATAVAAEATSLGAKLSAFWASYGTYITHALALAIGAYVGHKL